MAKRYLYALVAGATLSLAGCETATLPSDDVVSESALLDATRRLAYDIGKYNVSLSNQSFACPVHIVAYLSKIDLDYKVARNVTISGVGSGNIPIPPFILTPSVQGAASNITTGEAKNSWTFKPDDLPTHPALLGPTNSGSAQRSSAIKYVSLDPGENTIRADLEGQISTYLGTNHEKPCITPGDYSQAYSLQVENKAGGGLTLNFIVASVGGTDVVQNDYTQTVTFTFSFAGSSALDSK